MKYEIVMHDQFINAEVVIIETAIKELKKGDFFTKKAMANPRDNQVWIKGNYCRDIKKYECVCYDDINRFTYIPGNKLIYTNFIF